MGLPPVGALRLQDASCYLGMEPGSRWLDEPDCPVPYVDIRKPGAARAQKRWRVVDLDAFLAARLVKPGHDNPLAGG
jgi:hypothetical protein